MWLGTCTVLCGQITRSVFIVVQRKLQSEYTNRGRGFQICGKYLFPTHRSCGMVHSNHNHTYHTHIYVAPLCGGFNGSLGYGIHRKSRKPCIFKVGGRINHVTLHVWPLSKVKAQDHVTLAAWQWMVISTFKLVNLWSYGLKRVTYLLQGGPKKVIPLVHYITLYERYHFFGPPCRWVGEKTQEIGIWQTFSLSDKNLLVLFLLVLYVIAFYSCAVVCN